MAVLLEDPGRWEEVSKNYTHSVFLTADTFGDEDGRFWSLVLHVLT